MAFLDRLVSDMIHKSTGYNARKMVRRVGGRNILLLGGALVGGALLNQKMQGGQTFAAGSAGTVPPSGNRLPPRSSAEAAQRAASTPPAPTSRPAVAPPPPPPPGAAAPNPAPPPPPGSALPGAAAGEPEASESELPPALLYAIVRTMVAASLADGELSADERSVIENRLEEAPLSEQQVARIRKDLVFPAAPAELASLVEEEDREVLLRFGILVALAHEGVSEAERRWLEQLASALGFEAGRLAELEREIFETAGDR